MGEATAEATDSDRMIQCPGGELAVREFGTPGEPLVVCVPGLSANLISYERIAARLAATHHVVTVDLRGRGRSEITPAGTYGWPAHIADILAIADVYGAERFDLVGHSMGAWIAMAATTLHPQRINRAVLIDAAGLPEPSSLGPIGSSIARLGSIHASRESYLDGIRAHSPIQPWDNLWDDYYSRELDATDDGVRVRTDLTAITEDATYGSTQDPYSYWPQITRPTLLVRATEPMVAGTGLIVSDMDGKRFGEEVAGSVVIDVPANHFTMVSEESAIAGIAAFLAS
jgi:pimeloyl-ACP methyl ester carboxylesterase